MEAPGEAWLATVTPQEAIQQISPMADRIRASLPRRKTQNREKPARDKYSNYRKRMVSEGRCPHCGKPCAPFYECAERRGKKQFARVLRELIKEGTVRIVGKQGRQTLYKVVN
jgi:hypothetical protein